jgi:nicotinamide-nucleotide amidase
VALALADGARRVCMADWGVGTTGVAGPDPQDGVPVGTVYLACRGPDGGEVRGVTLDGNRALIRAGAVAAALDRLAEALEG